jgi:hypothetical protein
MNAPLTGLARTQPRTPPEPSIRPAEDPVASRTGAVGMWAVLGLLSIGIAGQAWVRWVLSSALSPAPILGPDHFPTWRLVTLRSVELVSLGVFGVIMWAAVVRPLRRGESLGIDGRTAIGCLIASITDGVLNLFQYLFAWNAHSINLGSWNAFLPLHAPSAPTQYAEALVWGVPMYLYFCIGVGMGGTAVVMRLRRRFPGTSNARALAVVFALACVFDVIVENGIIRLTQAYEFAKTMGSLTLWAGSQYQFPVYEFVLVALLGVVFTALRLSALDHPDGVSFAERGFERFRPRLQRPVRLLAVVGFCVCTLFCVYHLGFNWLGTNGHSLAPLPSYLQAR